MERESGAGSGAGADRDIAAVAREDVADGPKAHAVSALALRAATELKERRHHVRIDAAALIGNDDFDVGFAAGQADCHLGAGRNGRLAGIADEVQKNLTGLAGEGLDGDFA